MSALEIADIIGVICFALSGFLIAVHYKLDILGVFISSFLTALGGGIVAIVPQKMSICVYSPKLNAQGNSLIGTKALELFTSKTGLSIF